MNAAPVEHPHVPHFSRRRRLAENRYIRNRWRDFLSVDHRGMMTIEGVPVDRIVAKYGTPVYVMVESKIRRNFQRFKKVFGEGIKLQYAVKCNSNLEILRMAREENFELDCASVGEIILGLLADFKPRQLSYTNLFKTDQDLHFAVKMGVQSITADSIEDMRNISDAAKKLRTQVRTVIRVNPMIEIRNYSTKGNKYGVPVKQVMEVVELAAKSPFIDFRGFHFMGGYISSPWTLRAAARILVKIIRECQDSRVPIKTLSLGGGFPAAIGDQSEFPVEDLKSFPKYFQQLLDRSGVTMPIQLIFEPGKSIVLHAGIGLMHVVANKEIHHRNRMIIADGSTYNFIPDALVQSDIRYDILPASKMFSPRVHKVTVGGNTCDCWDLITKGIEMPKLQAGDILAAMDVGAYAQVLANNFNTIKRAPVVLIHESGTIKQIRRRDRYSEMFAPELDVLKMADPNELEYYNNLYRINIDKIWKGGQAKKKGAGKNGK
ncbi:MAG: diaminopimelate decarboxylase [Candidatus Peregrinibacteria bacterium Greene1014_49]|nr:MAG: diaminopimelate decarboxylase [Candidatus Peregrinibacteria bacterium Greene1014_49]